MYCNEGQVLRTSGAQKTGQSSFRIRHGYLVRYQAGDVFTDGYERVLLRGDQPGVLERVDLGGPGVDHFELLGVLLAGPKRDTGAVQVYGGFTDQPTDPAARGLGELGPG